MMIDKTQSSLVSVRILVTGRVQRVGFRQAARQQAHKLGLSVTAINREDGSVLLETSGARDIVDHFIAWARRGPALAEVSNITVINTIRPAMGSDQVPLVEGSIHGA